MTHYRLPGHDYRRGFHFITISTEPRQNILSRIEDGRIILSSIGKIVERALKETLALYPDLHLLTYMIMPDHIHFVFEHMKPLPRHLGSIIGYFKGRVTRYLSKEINLRNPKIFEENYHDIVSLDGEQLERFVEYVNMNPLRWQWKNDNREFCTKYYDLVHKRLPKEVSWTAIGDKSLLDWPRLMPVVISRKTPDYELGSIVQQYIQSLQEGYILVSGFVSPGEKAVLNTLRNYPNARIIALLPHGMAHYQAHGRAIDRLKDGLTLVLSGFPENIPTTPIHRENCLLNNQWVQFICRALPPEAPLPLVAPG